MQIMSSGENLHEMSKTLSGKNLKKKITQNAYFLHSIMGPLSNNCTEGSNISCIYKGMIVKYLVHALI